MTVYVELPGGQIFFYTIFLSPRIYLLFKNMFVFQELFF